MSKHKHTYQDKPRFNVILDYENDFKQSYSKMTSSMIKDIVLTVKNIQDEKK